MKPLIDNTSIKDVTENLYNSMFDKYYSDFDLPSWDRCTFFGGGNAEKYKDKISELLTNGFKVKTGYCTSSKIRGHKTHYIFYK